MNPDMIIRPPDKRDSSTSKQLTKRERGEANRRGSLRAAVVFETIRLEGQQELDRPTAALAFSGLAAGLSMGFSLVASGMIRAALPDTPWRGLLENLGYTLGFMIVVLGRQQLFTENTVTAIVPLLDDPKRRATFARVLRLWSIVLAANLIGAFIFAEAVAHTNTFAAPVKAAFLAIGMQALSYGFATTLVKGIFAGWLIALMVWLLPAAENARLWVILIVTYVVGAASLSHIIAGSVEALYAVVNGSASWQYFFVSFVLPVFIGNSIGGVLLVSMLNYAQVAPENAESTGSGDYGDENASASALARGPNDPA
ncbi:MAG: formate/nitrite transporter family protein [Candidatus Eremiobacteraeota bacterium]|nr:formate/nitrite transporter family protein [Candidatus Eremiobacteraeota bacterium]